MPPEHGSAEWITLDRLGARASSHPESISAHEDPTAVSHPGGNQPQHRTSRPPNLAIRTARTALRPAPARPPRDTTADLASLTGRVVRSWVRAAGATRGPAMALRGAQRARHALQRPANGRAELESLARQSLTRARDREATPQCPCRVPGRMQNRHGRPGHPGRAGRGRGPGGWNPKAGRAGGLELGPRPPARPRQAGPREFRRIGARSIRRGGGPRGYPAPPAPAARVGPEPCTTNPRWWARHRGSVAAQRVKPRGGAECAAPPGV